MISALWGFLWANRRIFGPLALAVAVLLIGLYLRHVWIKQGRDQCRMQYAAAQAEASRKARTDRERIEHETALMSDDAVDADLVRLGIMRPPSAR